MLKVITAPETEPVHPVEFANYARLDETEDLVENDARNSILRSAREYCEAYQRRAYITQTLEMSLDSFPRGVVMIPRGQLQSVDSVKYRDSQGVEHALEEGTDYVVSTYGVVGRIAPVTSWPSVSLYPLDAVIIRFTCGYGRSEDVPYKVKQAILMLADFWYDNRSAVITGSISKEVEFSVKALLGFERIGVPDASR